MLDGVRGPADAPRQHEEPKGSVARERVSAGECGQGKIDIRQRARRLCNAPTKVDHHRIDIDAPEKQPGARIAVGIEGMAKAGERLVAGEPTADGWRDARALGFLGELQRPCRRAIARQPGALLSRQPG